MNIHWDLRIKFRFMFFDLGKLEKSGDLPIPVPPVPVAVDKVLVDERGVYLHVRVG